MNHELWQNFSVLKCVLKFLIQAVFVEDFPYKRLPEMGKRSCYIGTLPKHILNISKSISIYCSTLSFGLKALADIIASSARL